MESELLDDELFEAIRKRQASNAGLQKEMDDFVRETSSRFENGDLPTATTDQTCAESEKNTCSLSDLARVKSILEQKEADLELAAKIGEALYEENSRLRQEVASHKDLAQLLEQREDQLLQSQSECKSLHRKIGRLCDNLKDADDVNSHLKEELLHMTEKAAAPSPRLTSHEEPFTSTTFSYIAPSRYSSALSQTSTSSAAEVTSEEDLEGVEASLECWRKRALAAERNLGVVQESNKKWVANLVEVNEKLEKELKSTQFKLENALPELYKATEIAKLGESLRAQVFALESELDALEQENVLLKEDLKEHKMLIGETRPRVASDPPAQQEEVRSLESELAAATQEFRDSVQQPKSEVDPYFFHFHMTAMFIKSQLSRSEESVGPGSNHTVVSRAVLDTINGLDTKAMYKEAFEKTIPPHEWIGFIRECFTQAYLRTQDELTLASQKSSPQIVESRQLGGAGDKLFLLDSETRFTSRRRQQINMNEPQQPSYFGRLLARMTAASPEAVKTNPPHRGRSPTHHDRPASLGEPLR